MKRSSYSIKERILLSVKEKSATYAELERKVNTGYRTIKANCQELQSFGLLQIKAIPDHEANGKPYNVVSITTKGLDVLKKK